MIAVEFVFVVRSQYSLSSVESYVFLMLILVI